MKKRLICLFLSILMLLTCALTACSTTKTEEEDTEETQEDNSAKTITMWVIADDPVVEIQDGETEAEAIARAKAEQKKAQDAVQAAFSAMTKSKFKTNVVLRFCSEGEYYAALEKAIEANQVELELEAEYSKAVRSYINTQQKSEAGKDKSKEELTKEFHKLPENAKYSHLNPYDPKNNISLDDDEDAPTPDQYTENEYGVSEILYPEAKENQVDIFYIGNVTDKNGKKISGYSKYMQYIENEWLAALNENLSTASKKLESYISPSLLKGVEVDAIKYAIPNNVVIGEYTYMLIDKQLFDKYYHKIDDVSGLNDLGLFLSDVMYENAGKTSADDGYIVPLASSLEECIKMQAWYWDIDYKDISVYETYYDRTAGRNYVLQYSYEISGSEEGSASQTALIDWAVEDVQYRVDDQGRFLDKDNKVLPYTYAVETEYYWTLDDEGEPKKVVAPNSRSLYLVDGDGNPVTPDNDKRVIEDAETNIDAYGNVRPSYLYFINQDADFSVLGSVFSDPSFFNRGSVNLSFDSLFADEKYRDLYATLKDYEYKGYYGTPAANQSAAISFVKGDAKMGQDYKAVMEKVAAGDSTAEYIYNGRAYHVLVAEYPMATEEELYGNMFAVYENSPYLARAMEVLTYLNTNTEMRDLLQYGIEDYHYERNEDGTVHLLSGDRDYGTYRMTLARTGNCFIATPDEKTGVDAWRYAKIQNNESLIHPLLGFDFNSATADSDFSLDVQLLDYIKRLNQEAADRIAACENKEELVMLMTNEESGFMYIYTADGADNKEKMRKALNPSYDPSEAPSTTGGTQVDVSGSSPYTVYYEWMTECKYLPSTVATN